MFSQFFPLVNAEAEVKIVWKPSLKMATYKRGALLRAPLTRRVLKVEDNGCQILTRTTMGNLGFKGPIFRNEKKQVAYWKSDGWFLNLLASFGGPM